MKYNEYNNLYVNNGNKVMLHKFYDMKNVNI